MLWILHGKLFDKFDEYFIYKLVNSVENGGNGSNKLKSDTYAEFEQEEWDGIFSMRYSMLPKLLITEKSAEKILFIGKSVRVLLAANEISKGEKDEIFSEEIIEVIKEAQKFDFLNL